MHDESAGLSKIFQGCRHHGKRIGTLETKLEKVDEKVGTILEIVKATNGDRTQVRGEASKPK